MIPMENFPWFVGALIIVLGIVYFQEQSGKKSVKHYLEQKGFEDIEINTRLFAGGGKGSITYDVKYRERNGLMHDNSCVVHSGIFSDSTIYWEKPMK